MQRREGGGKVQRITEQTQGLVDDLKEWVDLRIELVRIDVEEQIEAQANQVALGVILAGLGLLAVLFGLTALGFGLGALFGHPGWGFLAVTVLLVLLAVIIRAAKPELVDIDLRSKRGPKSPEPPSASSPRP
jgi:uncharacterized membrane protein YqjE